MSILQKNKKLAAGIGVAAIAAAALALGAGTYAAYTDSENTEATFAAGTLNLTVGTPVASDPVVWTNLAPGDVQEVTVSVDNIGTVDGVLKGSYITSGTEESCTEPETDDETTCDAGSELLEQAELFYNGTRVATLGAGPGGPFTLFDMPALDPATDVTFEVRVPSTAGNEIMTDTATMSIVFTLDQDVS